MNNKYLPYQETRLPTAEEFIKNLQTEQGEYTLFDAIFAAVEFAKLHVEAALKEA